MFLLLLLPFELPLHLPCNSRTPIKPSSAICIRHLWLALSETCSCDSGSGSCEAKGTRFTVFCLCVFRPYGVVVWVWCCFLKCSNVDNVLTRIWFLFCFWLTRDSDFCGFVWSLKEFLKPFLRLVKLLIQSYPFFFFLC